MAGETTLTVVGNLTGTGVALHPRVRPWRTSPWRARRARSTGRATSGKTGDPLCAARCGVRRPKMSLKACTVAPESS